MPTSTGPSRPIRLRRPLLWQRVSTLMWARRALWLLVPVLIFAMFRQGIGIFVAMVGIFLALTLAASLKAWEQSLRRQFVRDAALPRFMMDKLLAAFPQMKASDADLVLRGLRQFFMAHLRSDRKFVGMPSKVVDAAWHEFILHTQAYQAWCHSAFGSLLHHTPAEVMGRSNVKRNDGLRRTWYWACKEESIDPRNPTRLPLLFALDKNSALPGATSMKPIASRSTVPAARTPIAAAISAAATAARRAMPVGLAAVIARQAAVLTADRMAVAAGAAAGVISLTVS